MFLFMTVQLIITKNLEVSLVGLESWVFGRSRSVFFSFFGIGKGVGEGLFEMAYQAVAKDVKLMTNK